jgi:hypothetical protein
MAMSKADRTEAAMERTAALIANLDVAPAATLELSPERQTLADEIAALATAKAELAAIEAALWFDGSASQAVSRAEAALAAAEADLDVAKALVVSNLVAAGTGGTPPEPHALSVRAARAAVVDAQDDLESARIARAMLADRVEPARNRVTWEETMGLRSAAEAVIRAEMLPHSAAIFAEYAEVQSRAKSAASRLNFLMGIKAIDRPDGIQNIHGDAAQRWEDCLTSLMLDATTPLPE